LPVEPIPSASSGRGEPSPPLLKFADIISAMADDAQARYDAKRSGRPLGPMTGYRSLDDALGGCLAPGLHVVHGSPGVGKTAFALQAAASCGCAALYVTAEMTALELFRRHTARVTGTYLGKFKSGELPPDEVADKALRAASAAPALALLDVTETPATAEQIRQAAEATRRAAAPGSDAGGGHLLVVVDSLHSWADGLDLGDVTEYERLNGALASLRVLSKRLSCPVLAVAERNRSSMKSDGLSASAGTRKFEYGAESLLSLDADGDSLDDNGEIEVKAKISKNRNGATGKTFHLMFHGALQRYRGID